MRRLASCAFLLSVCALLSGQTQTRPPFHQVPPGDVARFASTVVLGQVQQATARREVNEYGDDLIVTDVVVAVSETVKGHHQPTVSTTILGGTVGDITMQASASASLEVGDPCALFLNANGRPVGGGVYALGRGVTAEAIRRAVRP